MAATKPQKPLATTPLPLAELELPDGLLVEELVEDLLPEGLVEDFVPEGLEAGEYVAAGVAVATPPTPPVTGPLSVSCWPQSRV